MNLNRNKFFCGCAVILISLTLTSLVMGAVKKAEIEQGISSKVVRFHVRANSGSDNDQSIKLKVRDNVLELSEQLLESCETKEESLEVLEKNISSIEKAAQQTVIENGGTDKVKAEIREEIFPVRKYGELVFPAGKYTSLVIEIGSGRGKNWWCVMFPKLCYIDESIVSDSGESQSELKHILSENEYNAVTGKSDIEIGFKFAEIIDDIF